jgi:excinuclease UvrABC nuclease subunit
MTLEQVKKKLKRMPDAPGVYFFLGKNKKVLYIGKATSLRDRVRSYFGPDLLDTRGPLLAQMVRKASSIDWRQTDSVLEALLLEASLVRAYKPPHNTELKDDKSFNYVVITKEEFPQVLVVRGRNIKAAPKHKALFGPFPHGRQLQEALKLIRKIFPYRDAKCKPLSAGRASKPCFNYQLGLCPGVCVGAISKQEYGRTIRHILLLFQGKKKQLIKSLNKEMRAAAKDERFEEAKELHRQMYALQHIQDISLIKDVYRNPSSQGGVGGTRIEAYDVAHLRGSAAVGVMVVVEDGATNKSQYRKFKIKSAKGGDDAGALREIITRRLGHDEWPLPRLIAVDGASAQINAAQRILAEYGMAIPVVGVTKDEKHRPRNISGDRELIAGRERDILLANAEAHRFAIGYHRNKSRKNLVI